MGWHFNNGRLTSPGGTSWSAKSGNFGKGHLPEGLYKIGEVIKISPIKINNDFKDRLGFAWWYPISPQFDTSRSRFGIHPDGGRPGTRGCIGIQCYNTRSVYSELKNTNGSFLYVGTL